MNNIYILKERRLNYQKQNLTDSQIYIKAFSVLIIFITIAVAFSVPESSPTIFTAAVPLLLLQIYSSVAYYKILKISEFIRLNKSQIHANIILPSKVGSVGLAIRDGFFIIFLCFDFVWLLSAYIIPSPTGSFSEYSSRLQIGPFGGMGFLIFTVIFWIVYILLFCIGGYTKKELIESEKDILPERINRVEFSILVSTFRNEKISINGYRIPNKAKQPLILWPGFTQNGYVFDLMHESGSLAEYLWKREYDIWIFHPRGTGGSSYSKYSNSLDDFASNDIPEIINFVYKNTKIKPLLAGHSQGGITSILSMMGAQKDHSGKVSLSPETAIQRQAALKGLITFGSYPDFKFSESSSLQEFVNTGLKIKIFGGSFQIVNSAFLLRLLQIIKYFPVPPGYKFRNALLSRKGLSFIVFPLKFSFNKISFLNLWQFLYNIPNVFVNSRKYLFYRTMDGTFPEILSQFYNAIKTGNMFSSDHSVNYSEMYGSINLPVSFVAMERDTLADPTMMEKHMFDKVSSKEKHFTLWRDQGHEDFFMNPVYFRQAFDAINLIDRKEYKISDDSIANMLMLYEEDYPSGAFQIQKDTYLLSGSRVFKQPDPKQTKPVPYNTNGEEIFVVSDLHIAGGKNEIGVYRGTENFFDDDSFIRFLNHANKTKNSENAILIINGDIFDFLRVVDFPGRQRRVRLSKRIKRIIKGNPVPPPPVPEEQAILNQYKKWSDALSKLGIHKNIEELSNSISGLERKYGLKTNDFKTIWKLELIREGHAVFFKALASWLAENNKIIILKGNHDVEISWLNVRNYLRLALAETIHAEKRGELKKILNKILPDILFIDDSIVIDDEFYIEHGHRYDKFTLILDDPVSDVSTSELCIPFGSFYNRYLVNRVELFYPFFDNVRPQGNFLPMLIKENFSLALKILFQHIPLVIRVSVTNRKYLWYVFGRVFLFSLALIIPVIILFGDQILNLFWGTKPSPLPGNIGPGILETLKTYMIYPTGLLVLGYLMSRLMAWLQLEEPDSLEKFAKQRFQGTDYRIMTMGHTHNPGSYKFGQDSETKFFFNTGTWIPVIETTTADIREDKTYTFLHLIKEDGSFQVADGGLLQRWNDDAGRVEPQILLERK